jgi:hypothetical protein
VNSQRIQISESAAIHDGPTNGAGAAALLAAGVGVFFLAALSVTADHVAAIKSHMIFYKPTGPLSGVTSSAIVVWLVVWAVLEARWKRRTVALKGIVIVALVLLALGLVLTFPPVGDLF